MALNKVNLIHKGVADALTLLTGTGQPFDAFHLYTEIPLTDDIVFPNLCIIRSPLGIQKQLHGGEHIDGVDIVVMVGFRERDLTLLDGEARYEREALLNHYIGLIEDVLNDVALDPSIEEYHRALTTSVSYPTDEGNDRYVAEFHLTIHYKA
jgi:hypothetical protein